MLLIRVAILAALICLHVIGGAVLFRKLFPRESAWWGFFAPTLALVTLLNFIEHGVAVPSLFWLLPVSSAGMMLALIRAGRSRQALLFPGALFLGVFAFTLAMKCLQCDINFYFTEGLTDTNRILNFCLGDKLPPTDSWLPPYRHTGYYTFMQYGASVMKRLLDIDVGTACNLGSALVSAFTLLGAGATAYRLSRGHKIITLLVVLVVAGGFTGASPATTIFQPTAPDPVASIDIGLGGDNDASHAVFSSFLKADAPDMAYRIYTPGCYIYYPEFHATMAGELLAIWTVFAVVEILRRKRSLVPWIYLVAAPVFAFISCSWFIFMVLLLAGPTLLVAWGIGRKPVSWTRALVGSVLVLALVWPAFGDLLHGAAPARFCWSEEILRDRWTIIFQWWPIYLPWLVLCWHWRRLDPATRWLHFLLVPIFVVTEIFYFDDRGTMLEKTWGGVFGISMVALYPALFALKTWGCRVLNGAILLTAVASLAAWVYGCYDYADASGDLFHLEGDRFLVYSPSMRRMEEVLGRIHGQTVITGVAHRAFFESPCLPAFTENRCYLGWTNAEETCGHPAEADQRENQINAFFAGQMDDPLQFLRAGDIAAVMVWPDDKIPDAWLAAMKTALAPDYTYVDCKRSGKDNAGIFFRNPAAPSAAPK